MDPDRVAKRAQRILDRQTLQGFANQMRSDPDQLPAWGEQKASDEDRSARLADRSDYQQRTKPTRRWPNALETQEKTSTTERSGPAEVT